MKTRLLIIIVIIFIIIPMGFLYFMANEGYSPYHAGISMEFLTEEEIQERNYDLDPQIVTRKNLEHFPQILTMLDLLIQEKNNPKDPRSIIVDFNTYFVSSEHNEYRVQNFMSDDGAGNLYREFRERFGTTIIFEENTIRLGSWIA